MTTKTVKDKMLRSTPRGGTWEVKRGSKLTDEEKSTIEKALDNFMQDVIATHDEVAKVSPKFAIPKVVIIRAIRTLQGKVWDIRD